MKRLLFSFIALIGLAAHSLASNRFELNFNAGLMNPLSGGGVSGAADSRLIETSIEGAGPSIGGGMFYWFGDHWAFGLEGGYTPEVKINEVYEYNVSSVFRAVPVEGTSKHSMTHVLAALKIGQQPDPTSKKSNAYFFIGAGAYERGPDGSLVVEGSATSGLSSVHIRNEGVLGYSIDSFGFVPGFGVSMPLGKSASLGFDLRFHILSQDGIRFINPMLQLSF